MPPDLDYNALIARMGEGHFRQRFVLQVEHAREIFGRGRTLFHIENVEWLMVVLYHTLRLCGVYGIGYRNFQSIRLVDNPLPVRNLPKPFHGFRILHVSDLHVDLDPGFADLVIARLRGLEYDLCVMTGDFRAHTAGDHEACVRETLRIARAINAPIYGVLGNHDFLEMIEPFENAGLRILLNETVPVERGGETLHLSGVDDPHFYEAENLHKTRQGIPPEAVSILLSHSPEIYRKAAASGYALMLCGHTHGGQICLPARFPILRNAKIPLQMTYGNWRHNTLLGYTSGGTGSCGVPVRYFCPPEIVIHRLVEETPRAAGESAAKPSR